MASSTQTSIYFLPSLHYFLSFLFRHLFNITPLLHCFLYPYFTLFLCLRIWSLYTAFGKSLCAYKRCWKWCPRASIQAWNRLILFANTFCRSAFGKSLCTCNLSYTLVRRVGQEIAQSVKRLANAGRSVDQILVDARFFAPVQTGPGAHPASYTMTTRSFQGGRRPGRGLDHRPPSSVEVKERVGLWLYSRPGPSWPVLG
jgi:hypothetical protein